MIPQGNHIMTNGLAVINGKQSGLAGCSNKSCSKPCLRQHPELRPLLDESATGCPLFIAAGAQELISTYPVRT
jgi:hypothetical protein